MWYTQCDPTYQTRDQRLKIYWLLHWTRDNRSKVCFYSKTPNRLVTALLSLSRNKLCICMRVLYVRESRMRSRPARLVALRSYNCSSLYIAIGLAQSRVQRNDEERRYDTGNRQRGQRGCRTHRFGNFDNGKRQDSLSFTYDTGHRGLLSVAKICWRLCVFIFVGTFTAVLGGHMSRLVKTYFCAYLAVNS